MAAGATGVVHGAMEMVLLGIGEAPSHSSPDQPLTPFRSGFLLQQGMADPTAEEGGLNDG